MTKASGRNISIANVVPELAYVGQYDTTNRPEGDIKTISEFNNFLNFPVTVVDRSGLRFVVDGKPKTGYDGFIIRDEIIISDFRESQMEKAMSMITDLSSEESRVIKEGYQRALEAKGNTQNFTGYLRIIVDYNVPLKAFEQSGGTLYYKNKDYLLSSLSVVRAPHHPHAEDSVIQSDFEEGKSIRVGRNMFATKIEIVDNAMEIGHRYYLFMGQVYQVKPIIDDRRSSGVYVTMVKDDITDEKKHILEQIRYEPEEAQQSVGLYRTKQEAIDSGDMVSARKERLLLLEHDIELLKKKLAMAKNEHEIELADVQRKNTERAHELKLEQERIDDRSRRLERERKEFEIEQDRRRSLLKDEFERRSLERKDTSELIKFLPLGIITLGACITAFSKLSK